MSDRAMDYTWAVWFRDALRPGGRWSCWAGTAQRTRAEAIETAWGSGYGAMRTRKDWNRLRKRGVVACRITFLSAHLEREVER